jgi:hypothetical protein
MNIDPIVYHLSQKEIMALGGLNSDTCEVFRILTTESVMRILLPSFSM